MTYVEPEYLLNEFFGSEMPFEQAITSPLPNYEVPIHTFEFNVPEECNAFVNIHIPLVTYHYIQTVAPAAGQPIDFNLRNGAVRAYLNGTAMNIFPNMSASQWNSPGGALIGGGQWNFAWAGPVSGLVEGAMIPIHLSAGTNTLRIHGATNNTDEKVRLMGPRWFRIYRLKVVGNDDV